MHKKGAFGFVQIPKYGKPSKIIFKIEPDSKNIELYIEQKEKNIPLKNNLKLIY